MEYHQQAIQWQGKMLGRYAMLHLLGRGGMGEVWLAQDTTLRRQVAIKLLPSVLMTDSAYLHDFTREAQAAASLEHPHILPVHDFGEQQIAHDEIVPYLVTPFISGGSLSDRIHSTQGPLPLDESLLYLRHAAEAIDYAHSRNMLHRDIKPANMLLQDQWLFLADFGLAKILSSATSRTRTHAGAGTPEYMAPEQAMGHAILASDRYSLAIIAYQLFAGQLPFQGDTTYSILIKQMKETPPSPRQFNPAIPPSVEEILLKGLAKSPEERPSTSKAFVDSLEAQWRLSSLQQRDPDATVLAPWSRRLQTPSSLGLSNTPAYFVQSAQQPASAPGPTALTPATPTPYLGTGMGNAAMHPPLITPTLAQANTIASQGSEQRYMPQTYSGIAREPLTETPSSERPVPKMRRRTLLIGAATTTAAIAVGGFAASTLLLHRQSPQTVAVIPGPKHFVPGTPILSLAGHSDEVWVATWDSNGHYLATAGKDTRLMLWDMEKPLKSQKAGAQTISTPLRQWKFSNAFFGNSIAWLNNDRSIAVTPDANNAFYLVDASNSAKAPVTYTDAKEAAPINDLVPFNTYLTVSSHQRVNRLAISQLPDYRSAYSALVEIWDIHNTQQPYKVLTQKTDSSQIHVQETQWSIDGTLLAALLDNFTLVLWDTKTGGTKKVLQLPSRTTKNNVFLLRSDLSWSPVNPFQIISTNIDVISLFDIRQDKLLFSLGTDDPDALTPPKNNTTGFAWLPNVTGIAWSPNGRYIAGSYGRSNKIYVWDLQDKHPKLAKDGTHIQTYLFGAEGGHSNAIINLAWSPDGRYLASTSFDKTVIVWKVDAS